MLEFVELFDHKYVPPPLAVNVAVGFVQLKMAVAGVMLAVAALEFPETVADATAVQPFAAVTVTA
jgi:hypothetical protein